MLLHCTISWDSVMTLYKGLISSYYIVTRGWISICHNVNKHVYVCVLFYNKQWSPPIYALSCMSYCNIKEGGSIERPMLKYIQECQVGLCGSGTDQRLVDSSHIRHIDEIPEMTRQDAHHRPDNTTYTCSTVTSSAQNIACLTRRRN